MNLRDFVFEDSRIVPDVHGPVDTEPRERRRITKPFCLSEWCHDTPSSSGIVTGREKFGIARSAIFCPDCGHALVWRTSIKQNNRGN